MTPKNAALVQISFGRIFAHKADLSNRFYVHLFQHAPEVEPLFKHGMSHQKEMFGAMLATVVKNLNTPDRLSDVVQRLVQQHAMLNIEPQHFEAARAALTLAIEDCFRGDLSDEEKAAWSEAITHLTNEMARENT